MKKILFTATVALMLGMTAEAAAPPKPCGAVPTEHQLNWLRMEWYAFVHFGLNTYTGREWGYGNESPELFNPTDFNARAIVHTFRQAGMTGMIYTAKHHDGWCAWPTATTPHSIKASPWKAGKGDVVADFASACRKEGLKFGVYLSPWDRNCAEYGRKGYLNKYYRQIKELLTRYGDIFEIWFDGANGGDGYYGGANEKRNIGNADTYYNYAKVVRNIRSLQPACIIWGAAQRGDVIWGGSEKGHVRYPCTNIVGIDTPNERWISLEGDTTINHAGWFWHPGQQNKVKSPAHLMQVYLDSVGRGANLILNVAPDRSGRLDPADVRSLLTFGELRRQLLAEDFATGAPAVSEQIRGKDPAFAADKLTDGDIESYWSTDDGVCTASAEVKLPAPVTFDVVRLREQIRLGQRVTSFTVEACIDGQWQVIDADGKTIGNQVLRKLGSPVTATAVRLNITGSRACPCISELSLLRMPALEQESRQPFFTRNASKTDWKVTPEAAAAAFDNNPDTFWHSTGAEPIVVDLGKPVHVSSFFYLPRQDGSFDDMTDRYTVQISSDGKAWKSISGEFSNLRANPIEHEISLPTQATTRYLKFIPERALQGGGASAAEINIR